MFSPTGPAVLAASASSAAPTSSAGMNTRLTMPRPPASATAAASAGVATPPIPACWIGTRQPTSSVKAVLSTMTASLRESLPSTVARAAEAPLKPRCSAGRTAHSSPGSPARRLPHGLHRPGDEVAGYALGPLGAGMAGQAAENGAGEQAGDVLD